jgi:hypothetical protein
MNNNENENENDPMPGDVWRYNLHEHTDKYDKLVIGVVGDVAHCIEASMFSHDPDDLVNVFNVWYIYNDRMRDCYTLIHRP